MNGMLALAKRNTLCYFRDRAAVVFSLMGVLVVVMLYLLFLRNMLIDSAADVPGISSQVDAWVLSGILGIVSVTTSAGSLQTMIEDRANNRDRDVKVTPMSPMEIAGGYIISTAIVGMVMSIITFVISVAYLAATGCPLYTSGILMSLVLLVPSALSGSIIIYAITSFFKSTGAFSGFFTIVSVLIGFLAGIYMPMGVMPGAMQTIGSLVPASHMASLFRQNLGGASLDEIFNGADPSMVTDFRTEMGYDLSIGGFDFTPELSILYVVAVTAVFFAIAVLNVKRR